MKAVFISGNQAQYDEVIAEMQKMGLRGFTSWDELPGCGTEGEPHLGTAAWPTMNSAILTFVPDEKKDELMALVKRIDDESPVLGLRAFWWEVGGTF